MGAIKTNTQDLLRTRSETGGHFLLLIERVGWRLHSHAYLMTPSAKRERLRYLSVRFSQIQEVLLAFGL